MRKQNISLTYFPGVNTCHGRWVLNGLVGRLVAGVALSVFLAGVSISSCFGKELTVGVYANPPKIFFDKNGIATGIHIDLIRQIAEREQWTLRFIPCEWLACLASVQRGEIDLLPDVAYTDERAARFDFHTVPALYSWSILYRNKDVAINSVFDLKGKRIAM